MTKNYAFESATVNNISLKIEKILYKLIKTKQYDKYWEMLEKYLKIKGLSENFKDLFLKLVAYNPDERPTMEEIKNTVGENFESLLSDICQEIPYDDISDVGLENELRFKELYLPSSVLNDIANYLSFTKNPTQLKFTIPQTGGLERYSHQADFKKRLRTYYTWKGSKIYQAYNNQSFKPNWRPSAPQRENEK